MDALQHFVLVERLGEEVAGAEGQRLQARLAVGLRAEHHHRRRLLAPAFAQQFEHPVAVEVRHADVEEDQFGQALLLQQRQQAARVVEALHVAVAVVFEQVEEQFDVDRVVVQHQQAGVGVAAARLGHQADSRGANSASMASSWGMSSGLVR